MRSCRECGTEFGLYGHFFLRSEFCSNTCTTAFQSASARLASARGQATISAGGAKSAAGPGPFVDLLQEGRPEPTLYFLGADFAEFRLAQLMGPGTATYGVKARWPVTSGKSGPLPTMEQITAPYAAAIAAHAPRSGCVLAGYSFAGQLAYAAARQLLKQGVNVEAVILIDARPRHPLQTRRVVEKKLRAIWRKPLGVGLAARISSIGSGLVNSWRAIQWMLAFEGRILARRYLKAVLRDPGPISELIDENGERMYWGFLERVISNAGKNYQLDSVDCQGILISVPEAREALVREMDPSLGWAGLFDKGLEIVSLPGRHITIMLMEPYTTTLARKLNELMSGLRMRQATKVPRRLFEGSGVS